MNHLTESPCGIYWPSRGLLILFLNFFWIFLLGRDLSPPISPADPVNFVSRTHTPWSSEAQSSEDLRIWIHDPEYWIQNPESRILNREKSQNRSKKIPKSVKKNRPKTCLGSLRGSYGTKITYLRGLFFHFWLGLGFSALFRELLTRFLRLWSFSLPFARLDWALRIPIGILKESRIQPLGENWSTKKSQNRSKKIDQKHVWAHLGGPMGPK